MNYKTIYDETTSKNAEWGGKTTKQFKKWKKIVQKGAKEAFDDWGKRITNKDIEGFAFEIRDRMIAMYIGSHLYKEVLKELEKIAQDEETFEEYKQSYHKVLEKKVQSELKERLGITIPPRPAKWLSDEKYLTDDGRIVVATDEKPYYKVLVSVENIDKYYNKLSIPKRRKFLMEIGLGSFRHLVRDDYEDLSEGIKKLIKGSMVIGKKTKSINQISLNGSIEDGKAKDESIYEDLSKSIIRIMWNTLSASDREDLLLELGFTEEGVKEEALRLTKKFKTEKWKNIPQKIKDFLLKFDKNVLLDKTDTVKNTEKMVDYIDLGVLSKRPKIIRSKKGETKTYIITNSQNRKQKKKKPTTYMATANESDLREQIDKIRKDNSHIDTFANKIESHLLEALKILNLLIRRPYRLTVENLTENLTKVTEKIDPIIEIVYEES